MLGGQACALSGAADGGLRSFETKEGHRRGTGEIIAGGRLPFYADLVRMVRSPGILEDTRALQKHTRSRDGSPLLPPEQLCHDDPDDRQVQRPRRLDTTSPFPVL